MDTPSEQMVGSIYFLTQQLYRRDAERAAFVAEGRGRTRAEIEQCFQSHSLPWDAPTIEEIRSLRVIEADAGMLDVLVPLFPVGQGISNCRVRLRLQPDPGDSFGIEVVDFDTERSVRVVPAPVQPVERVIYPPPAEFVPVPVSWRGQIWDLVHRLVVRDYAGLARDGCLTFTSDPTDASIGMFVEAYPDELVDLPEEAWAYSDHFLRDGPPVNWYFRIDLWTRLQGQSDLTLEGYAFEQPDGVVFKVMNPHIM